MGGDNDVCAALKSEMRRHGNRLFPWSRNVVYAIGGVVFFAAFTPSSQAFHFTEFKSILPKFDLLHVSRAKTRATSIAVASVAFPEGGGVYRNQVAVHSASYLAALEAIQILKRELEAYLRQNSCDQALQTAQSMLQVVSESASKLSKNEQIDLSHIADFELQALTEHTFSPPYRNQRCVLAGVELMSAQLATRGLASPYRTIPKRTLLNALSALTALTSVKGRQEEGDVPKFLSEESFRILQRLITGKGVRGKKSLHLAEKDFTQVLNAFCNVGNMAMAHRIVALQERTPHAPPVSPVAYSVLLKGYGRLQDLESVERVVKHAKANEVESDIIMLNTLINSYINCNAMDKAEMVFAYMKDGKDGAVRPNRRTYNTVLKGWAKQGALQQAHALSDEMKECRLWDSITTNTLVHAAVTAGNFTYAEDILTKHSMRINGKQKQQPQHPNVEAYTELLDGYAKVGQLDKALAVLQTMQQRGVEPNEVTYTCLMGGLGQNQKLDLAQKTFAYMESTGLRPTAKMYNALISGLVSETVPVELDVRVDEGMKVLRDMIHAGVRPNCVSVSVLVDAFGRCRIPRVTEASLLVDKLERQKVIPSGNAKVVTALVRTCGKAGDIQGVLQAFQKLSHHDTVAVNAFLDACCRCKREKIAVESFDIYFRKKKALLPDVISYSVLIGALLKQSTTDSLKRARNMYREMKVWGKIRPDAGLVDIILKGMIRIGTSQRLSKQDVQFVASVLKDAEVLGWDEGQLERRKRAVRAVLADRLLETWRKEDGIDSLNPLTNSDDELFQRKGWNKVDSGFRLWGGGRPASETPKGLAVDQFLQSHGWNDVDSSFRLF